MKKIFGLLVVLMFGINALGQGVFAEFMKESEHIVFGKYFNRENITNPTATNGLRTIYSFDANGWYYLVSYEQCEACKNLKCGESMQRNLYLYRWDGTEFNIAIDKPLRVDTYSYDDNCNITCDCFFSQMYGGNMYGRSEEQYKKSRIFEAKYDGNIEKLSDGSVLIKLTIFVAQDEKPANIYSYFYAETITLKPNGINYIVDNNKIITK